MKHLVQSACVAFTLLFGMAAHASTQALGFEIGATTLEQLKARLANQTAVTHNGMNRFSKGPMLQTDGVGYEVPGLDSVVYIFDDQDKLAAVLLTLEKTRFDTLFSAMAEKHTLLQERRLAREGLFARFKTADAMINMDAPIQARDLKMSYIRHDLLEKFMAAATTDAAPPKKTE